METDRPSGGAVPDRDADGAADSRAMWGARWRMSWAWGLTALGLTLGFFASFALAGRTREVVAGAFLVAQGIHLLYWNEPWARFWRFTQWGGPRRSPVIAGGVGAIVIGMAFIFGLLAS